MSTSEPPTLAAAVDALRQVQRLAVAPTVEALVAARVAARDREGGDRSSRELRVAEAQLIVARRAATSIDYERLDPVTTQTALLSIVTGMELVTTGLQLLTTEG